MIQRTIKDKVLNSIKNRPITLITGARQVGKSTLCKEIAKEFGYNYVSLDITKERQTAIKDPELFLELHKCPLIIDEVQYAPELFEAIEAKVNKEKFEKGNNYGMFILTGSQVYKLMNNVSQSLAGRVSIINMSPLSVSEINKKEEKPFKIDLQENTKRTSSYHITIDDLYEKIVKGFYPELYDNENLDADQFYSDYVATYINRDVSELINLNDKLKFENFMEILASLTGEELVYDTIAKAVGVTLKTIQQWISVLVSGDIIYLLQPYNEYSILKRVVKRPKIYFRDTGLACYLARLNNSETLKASFFNGRFVETYIINEILKSYLNNNKKANFYYYRDSLQREIDLIILDEGKLNLIECKAGITYKANDTKAFKVLEQSNYIIDNTCIICNTPSIYLVDKKTLALPISSI